MPLPANRSPKRKLLLLATLPILLACALPVDLLLEGAAEVQGYESVEGQDYRECVEDRKDFLSIRLAPNPDFVAIERQAERECTEETGYVPPDGNGDATDTDPVEADPPVEAVPPVAGGDQEEDRPDDAKIANDCSPQGLTPEECNHSGTHHYSYSTVVVSGDCTLDDPTGAGPLTFEFGQDEVSLIFQGEDEPLILPKTGANTYSIPGTDSLTDSPTAFTVIFRLDSVLATNTLFGCTDESVFDLSE